MSSKMGKTPSETISLNVHFKTRLDDLSVDYFNFVIVAFDIYDRHGVLPYPGSLSEQPNKIIEIFNVLSSLKQERDQKLLQEQQKEQKRNERRKR